MSISNNRLNTTATQAQIKTVKDALQTIANNLPFLIGLTIDERIALPSMNVSNKAFAEDALHAGMNNPSLIPPYLSIADMQNDMTLFNQLDEIIILTKQLLEKLEDTQLLAGSEAYSFALTLYKLFGNASNSGVPGAEAIVAQLKQRFAKQGGSGPIPNPS